MLRGCVEGLCGGWVEGGEGRAVMRWGCVEGGLCGGVEGGVDGGEGRAVMRVEL